MKDFWLSCGHLLTDRNAGGGLVVTDELLKAYLARPELRLHPDACAAERQLCRTLFAEPQRHLGSTIGRETTPKPHCATRMPPVTGKRH